MLFRSIMRNKGEGYVVANGRWTVGRLIGGRYRVGVIRIGLGLNWEGICGACI